MKAVPFTDIPIKSPDVSPMDFCAFGLLKSALVKLRPVFPNVGPTPTGGQFDC